MALRFLSLAPAILSMAAIFPTFAQIITTPCMPAMITSFTPCMNFLTNSTSSPNGTTPSTDCCNSLNSLMSNGRDCFCLIATNSVPFRIPINRTLAISLPRVCNMPGVPLQCKAAGAPVPAPGPGVNGPALSPNAAPTPSVQVLSPPGPLAPTLAPEADANPSTPTNNGGSTTPPTSSTTTGSRAGVTPSSSAANPSYTISPLLLVALFGAIAFK